MLGAARRREARKRLEYALRCSAMLRLIVRAIPALRLQTAFQAGVMLTGEASLGPDVANGLPYVAVQESAPRHPNVRSTRTETTYFTWIICRPSLTSCGSSLTSLRFC